MSDTTDPEKDVKDTSKHQEVTAQSPAPSPKLDPHGFPLRPQPTDDPKGQKAIQSVSLCEPSLMLIPQIR